MNKDEKIARIYLDTLGSNEHEPDGNITPDFAFGSSVGIEVRRLNRNFRNGEQTGGLETDSYSLSSAIQAALNASAGKVLSKKYWLALRYSRPIGKIKNIKKLVASSIQDFESNGETYPKKYRLSPSVEIEIAAEATNTSDKYSLGLFSDRDSGGWVIDMYAQEIDHCIQEKVGKVKPYLENYDSWWLILIDHLCAFHPRDEEKIKQYLKKPKEFEKILLLNHKGEIEIEI